MGGVPMKQPNPGELVYRVVVEQPVSTQNEAGESVLAWSTYATVWANVQALSSRETYQYGQQVGVMTHKIMIRFLAGLTSAMRIVYDSRNLEIGQISELERRTLQEIICAEKR